MLYPSSESIFLIPHTDVFCGKWDLAHEPATASGLLRHPREVYERMARLGPVQNRRVGKSRIVVKRRGVGGISGLERGLWGRPGLLGICLQDPLSDSSMWL